MTCQICFEDRDLEKGPYKCETDHFFCQSCIDKWDNRPCPICRSEPLNTTDNNDEQSSDDVIPMIIHYSNDGLVNGWNAFNQNININRTYVRPTRSRRQLLSILSAMDSFDSEDIQVIYDTFEEELIPNNRPILPRQNAIVSPTPLIDISTPANTINTVTSNVSSIWEDTYNSLYYRDRLNSIYVNPETNREIEIENNIQPNNTSVIEPQRFYQRLLNLFDIDRYRE